MLFPCGFCVLQPPFIFEDSIPVFPLRFTEKQKGVFVALQKNEVRFVGTVVRTHAFTNSYILQQGSYGCTKFFCTVHVLLWMMLLYHAEAFNLSEGTTYAEPPVDDNIYVVFPDLFQVI